jgi:hypothetical protein
MAAVVQLKSAIVVGDRQILCPFDKRECISLKQAADIAGKSESTCEIGVKRTASAGGVGGGAWAVSRRVDARCGYRS